MRRQFDPVRSHHKIMSPSSKWLGNKAFNLAIPVQIRLAIPTVMWSNGMTPLCHSGPEAGSTPVLTAINKMIQVTLQGSPYSLRGCKSHYLLTKNDHGGMREPAIQYAHVI